MGAKLIWDDPLPLKSNDYTISYIEPITDEFKGHIPIYIEYNKGKSDARVFYHEILIIDNRD